MRVLYKNATEDRISHPEGGTYEPGQSKTEAYFYKNLFGLTIVKIDKGTEDSACPWLTVWSDTIAKFKVAGGGPGILTGLAKFPMVMITNNSGQILEIFGNGDSGNPWYVLNGATLPISQPDHTDIYGNKIDLETLAIDGSGDGKVYVSAWRS